MRDIKDAVQLTTEDQRLINTLSALGDGTRFKIFKLLIKNDGLCVGDIAKQLNISISAVSQHFRKFEMIGLVDKERFGQKICYSLRLNDPLIKQLVALSN